MLFVNLIEERLRARHRVHTVVRFGVAGLVVVAVGLGALLLAQRLETSNLRKEIKKIEKEKIEQQADADECKRIIVSTVKIDPLWKLADEVIGSQQTWGLVLRAISECRPLMGFISLDTMASRGAEKEGIVQITLTGFASNEFAVSDYQRALNLYRADMAASLLFDPTATRLNEVSAVVREGGSVRNFVLEVTLSREQGSVPGVAE